MVWCWYVTDQIQNVVFIRLSESELFLTLMLECDSFTCPFQSVHTVLIKQSPTAKSLCILLEFLDLKSVLSCTVAVCFMLSSNSWFKGSNSNNECSTWEYGCLDCLSVLCYCVTSKFLWPMRQKCSFCQRSLVALRRAIQRLFPLKQRGYYFLTKKVHRCSL